MADALAGLVGAYAGAGLVIVREPDAAFLPDADTQERAHGPVARALVHHRADALLSLPAARDLAGAGYPAVARDWEGEGDAPGHPRLPAALWTMEPATFAERWGARPRAAGGGRDRHDRRPDPRRRAAGERPRTVMDDRGRPRRPRREARPLGHPCPRATVHPCCIPADGQASGPPT